MFSWAKNTVQSTLATVAGTAEPIYGAEALHSVAKQDELNPTHELAPNDLLWTAMDSTSVETQTFYIHAESGHVAMLQVLYSNVANIHLTAQLSVKVFHPDGKINFSSKPLSGYAFDDEKRGFYADEFAAILSEDSNSITIKSAVDPEAMIDITITRTAPGFKIGKDGKTTFGTDAENPWGFIQHMFWTKAKAEGTISVDGAKVNFAGSAMFSKALQGMKPHHAAAKWNFLNFQGPNISAVMMDFTTPPSYGSQSVTVGGIVKGSDLLMATSNATVEHTESKHDTEADWPEPTAWKYVWHGKTQDGKDVEATLEGPVGERLDRVDILEHTPAFVKRIVAGAAGTRPYIYQFSRKVPLKIKIGDEVIEEEGIIFAEATFIS